MNQIDTRLATVRATGWRAPAFVAVLATAAVAASVGAGRATLAAQVNGASDRGVAPRQPPSVTPAATPETPPAPTSTSTPGSGDLPDLIVNYISPDLDPARPCSDPEAFWGVSVPLQNVGAAPAGAFNLTFIERTNRVLGLAPGEAVVIWFRGGRVGEVEAIIDADGEVAELREDNNRRTQFLPMPSQPPPCEPTPSPTPRAMGPALPDLIPIAEYHWSCPCWPCPGSTPYGFACVANVGQVDAGRFRKVTSWGTGVEEVQDVAGLAAGARVCREIYSVSVEIIADSRERVEESDESNNRLFAWAPTYTPPPPCQDPTPTSTPKPQLPDLVVADARVIREPVSWRTPGSGGCAIPGEPYYRGIDVRVSNLGSALAGSFMVRSEPPGMTWSVDALGPDESRWLGAREGWADAVTVDADNQVAESDETNNRRVVPTLPPATPPLTCTQTPTPTVTLTPNLTTTFTPTPTGTSTPSVTPASPLPPVFAAYIPSLRR